MITSEQKDLCIKLYLEGNHTINEILIKTGLKYAPEVYRILDDAGIERKRKITTKEKSTETISIENSRMKFLSGLCRLYHNEPENPFNEEEEPFNRYMWRNEWKIMENARDIKFIEEYELDNPLNWQKFFETSIRSYIHLWTNPKNGETDRQWLGIYQNNRKANNKQK